MISGIFTALLTPFDKNNKINHKALEDLIDFNLNNGVDGFYVSGSTGEAFLISFEERKEIFDIVADKAKGKCTLFAHVGCVDTKSTVELGLYTKTLGYDGVSAITPFFYNFTKKEIIDHYLKIANNVDIPTIIYNMPSFTGVALSLDDICSCFDNDRIIGLKHTSNDFFMLERIKHKYPNKVVFNGLDEMFITGIAMGADGGIGSTYNFMADKFVAIKKHMLKGETKQALKIQQEANSVIQLLIKIGIYAGEKEILNNLGFDFGKPRLPFAPLNAEEKKIVKDRIMPIIKK